MAHHLISQTANATFDHWEIKSKLLQSGTTTQTLKLSQNPNFFTTFHIPCFPWNQIDRVIHDPLPAGINFEIYWIRTISWSIDMKTQKNGFQLKVTKQGTHKN